MKINFDYRFQSLRGLVDIGTKDIELLKELIAKNYPSLTVMQAWATLDPHEAGEK